MARKRVKKFEYELTYIDRFKRVIKKTFYSTSDKNVKRAVKRFIAAEIESRKKPWIRAI